MKTGLAGVVIPQTKTTFCIISFAVLIFCCSWIYFYKIPLFKTFVKSLKENEPEDKKYVSFCTRTFDSRRTGNLMFNLAALLYVSKITGRIPVLPQHFPYGWIDHIFDTFLPRLNNSFVYNGSLGVVVSESLGPLVYDEKIKYTCLNESLKSKTIIIICGWFQSYQYVSQVEEELKTHLKFKNATIQAVDSFIKNHTENTAITPKTIGLHVRRTDFITYAAGVVDESYINASLRYFIDKFNSSDYITLFVCSDDINWVNQTIKKLNIEEYFPNLKVVYSLGHDAGFDMCLLSKSTGMIISSGTYGWWSAWFANTTTVYFTGYPHKNSGLRINFKRSEYYSPKWIGMP